MKQLLWCIFCFFVALHVLPAQASREKPFGSRCRSLLSTSKDFLTEIFWRFLRRSKMAESANSDARIYFSNTKKQDRKETGFRPDDYVPRNKGMKPDDRPGLVVSVFNQPHQESYYGQVGYQLTDGKKLSLAPIKRKLISRTPEKPNHGMILKVRGDRLPSLAGYLHIPFGYVVKSYWGQHVHLFSSGRAIYYEMQTREDFVVQLKPTAPFDLDDEELAMLTKVENAPSLDLYPTVYQMFIQILQEERQSKALSTSQIARRVKYFLHKQMKYEVDQNSAEGVLDFCWTGTTQCDGASLVYVTILRTFFKIACEAVAGVMGAYDPMNASESLVIDNATPHMFVSVYDPGEKKFKVYDPTPPVPTRPKPKTNPNSPYLQWPRNSEKPSPNETNANIGQYWNALFENIESENWKHTLALLHQVLSESIDSQLSPDKKAADDLTRLTKVLGIQSLKEGVQLAMQHPQLKHRYLQLKRLEILAKYGRKYSGKQKKYDSFERTIAKILGFFGKESRTPRKMLSDKLPGEFSRKVLAETGGDLTIFFQLASLFQRIQLERSKAIQTYPSLHFDKSFTPTDDEEFDFEIVEDFDHIESFERQGFPAKYDGPRVAAGDMLRRVWRDPFQNGPAYPVEGRPHKELTIMLVDLSGSMISLQKGYARDRVVQMSIDELFSDGHEGLMVILGYRDAPEKPTYIRTKDEAEKYFRSMMVKREFYKSDKGNDTAMAFKRAIELYKELQDEFSIVNLRLITDGEENLDLDLMQEIRETVGWEANLNLTAVTLATGNNQLKKFVKDSSRQGLVTDGLFIHLSVHDISNVISGQEIREDYGLSHLLPTHLEDLKRVPPFIWRELEQIF